MAAHGDIAREALRQASAAAVSIQIQLDDVYLRRIALVEAMAVNQSGADKSWVWRVVAAAHGHHERAQRRD